MSPPDDLSDLEKALQAKMEEAFNSAAGVPDPEAALADQDDGPALRKGVIVSVSGDDVFVELGPRMQGVISLAEFDPAPQVGESYEFSLVSVKDELWTLSRKEAMVLSTWQFLEVGHVTKATVVAQNKGGLELSVGPLKAFMPISEISLSRVEDLEPFIGQSFLCEVREVSRDSKRVVLSRRAVLRKEQEQARAKAQETLAVGKVVSGTVEKIEPFGAFVDLGSGLSGLLHVSNMSHQRVNDPSKFLAVGQQVQVQVLEITEGGRRIGLGLKQLEEDPWDTIQYRAEEGAIKSGKVVRVVEFGAFVELEPGIEGLLHRSQLSPDRVRTVADVVKVGDQVNVRVLSVDSESRRIALSRLTERGQLLGAEPDLDDDDRRAFLDSPQGATTNLGALLREAMEGKDKKKR